MTGSGTTPSRAAAARYYHGGSINWVKTLDLNNAEIWETEEQVTPAAMQETALQLYPPGTVLVAMYGGFKQIGRTGLLQTNAAVNQALLAIRPCPDLSPKFLQSCLNFRVGYWRGVASSSRKDPNISSWDVKAFPIRYPTREEQEAIAAALSDVDGLIASLDRLIAKKRAIKQAAMQQLLTGKTRLPGFSGPWKVRRLGTLVDCLDNLRVPVKESERAAMPGPYPYCGANGVLGHVDRFVLDDDVILMAEDGGYFDEYETRPIAYRMRGKIWVNNHAHILKAKPMECQGFLYYSLVHKNILPYLASGTRAKLNKSEMNKIEIRGPLDFDEQSAIACVLDSSDRELDLLGTRREKAKAVKQGMMQALLTGRVRLPFEPAASGGKV